MKTLLKILLILLNLSIPFIVPIVLMLVCFFIYGSGATGTEKLERQMYIWTGVYIVIGLIHIFLAYRYIKFLSKTQRLVLIFFLTIVYVYLGFNYMVS